MNYCILHCTVQIMTLNSGHCTTSSPVYLNPEFIGSMWWFKLQTLQALQANKPSLKKFFLFKSEERMNEIKGRITLAVKSLKVANMFYLTQK